MTSVSDLSECVSPGAFRTAPHAALGPAIERAAAGYAGFISACESGEGTYRLTPAAEPTAFARCFAIFGMRLLRQDERLERGADAWARAIRSDVDRYRQSRAAAAPLKYDKFYLQLLTFSLSALWILGRLARDPLEDHILPLLSTDVAGDLRRCGALDGVPRSGNLAMFMAILLLHARDALGVPTQARVDEWVELHLRHMNRHGFWGRAPTMTHLQFQNGYHQYEIFDYLGVHNPRAAAARSAILELADSDGHFAPYPGGGGCYDYDAIAVLTGHGETPNRINPEDLYRTATTILREQQPDGGFAETLALRPRSWANLRRAVRHVGSVRTRSLFMERLRWCLAVQRPRHDRIKTQWSDYARRWDESDLWDSWFRMLSLARIQLALEEPEHAVRWGFIDFPGIGFHPCVRSRTGA